MSTVVGVLTAVCVVGQALLLAHVIAATVTDGAMLEELTAPLVALVGVTLARAALTSAFGVSGSRAASASASALRARLADALLDARPVALHGARQGALAAAATSGIDALDPFYSRYLPQLVLSVAVPVVVLLAVVRVDVTSALVMAVTVPLIPVFMVLIGRAAEARTRARWASLSLLAAHFLDVVRGLPTLVANNRATAQLDTVRAVGDRNRRETMGTLRIAFLSALVLEGLAMLGTALVAVTIGVRLAQGGLGLEAGLAILLLAPELYLPLRQLGAHYHAAADATAAADAVFEAIDLPRAVAAPRSPRPAPSAADGPVELRAVTFRYPGGDAPVLQRVDLRIDPGETVAVSGPSGSGKSTLGLLLVRLVAPTSGVVSACGVDLADVDPDAWRAGVAWVPQRPRLLPGTLADNVRLGRPEADDDAVAAALVDASAEHLLGLLDVRVGEGARELSVGERRRVAIARALLRDTPLAVLDEPTADLDPEAAAAVADGVLRLAEGRSVLLVTHGRALAARADRALELVDGRLRPRAAVEEAPR